ncbi:MAG: NYN domain-containing protein [Gemmataceae bacterium]|nr:NYN domain-containing protein [Gemmataceae bacterium]
MLYLIDGYNLLHNIGVMRAKMAPAALHHARGRLLSLLQNSLKDDADSVTVVFDATKVPAGATEVQHHRGIEVRFAVHHDEADDLIEQLIKRAAAPKKVVVVSDDHRLQRAARRRHCAVMGCGDFLDWLNRKQGNDRPRPSKAAPDKPESVSREEMQHWLKEFGDLQNDPDFKEAFDPFDFDDGPKE